MTRPNNDNDHISALREYFAQKRAFPSYARLGELLGFQGKAGAYKLTKRLIAKGVLERTSDGRLIPGDRFFDVPQLDDRLHAGTSESTSWTGSVEPHSLDRLLIEHPSRTVLMLISGDSMIEAGVLDGDTAIVERTENAQAGDFVAALVDGQYTIKELQYEMDKPVLVPHNRQYEIIRPQQELRILGVVKGIARSYGQRRKSAKTLGEK